MAGMAEGHGGLHPETRSEQFFFTRRHTDNAAFEAEDGRQADENDREEDAEMQKDMSDVSLLPYPEIEVR
jgi:hypothetical protein